MDKEVLDEIRNRLLHVKVIIDPIIEQLDSVEVVESLTTGKSIVPDFDDTDLTNVLVSVDEAVSDLEDLSTEISSYLDN